MSDKSAFPYVIPSSDPRRDAFAHDGMSLREWQWTQFAAAVLQGAVTGMMTNPDVMQAMVNASKHEGNTTEQGVVDFVLRQADAMMSAIEAREKDDV